MESFTQQCRSKVVLKKLGSIQTQIIQVITDRSIELDILHCRIRGHMQAKKVITLMKSGLRQLDKLVKNFNQETAQINNDRLLSLQRKQELQGLHLPIQDIVNRIPVPPPPSVPAVNDEQQEVEAHGHDLEEEVAATIMMQNEIDSGYLEDGIGSVDDFGNKSELLQD
ncbi:hypothetical protein BDD12DRAFT_807648 [Trichophaea hybrida]|nr:hypothetical protein BDD12DRAFT_807648 [Trichophaea hybrida]